MAEDALGLVLWQRGCLFFDHILVFLWMAGEPPLISSHTPARLKLINSSHGYYSNKYNSQLNPEGRVQVNKIATIINYTYPLRAEK